MNLDWKLGDAGVKGGALNGIYNANTPYHNNNSDNNNNGSGTKITITRVYLTRNLRL